MSEAKKRIRGGSERSKSPPSFEASVQRLEEIVTKLEGGELPLEAALGLFEEGIRLARASQDQLEHAERRVEELLGIDENGQPLTRDLELDVEE